MKKRNTRVGINTLTDAGQVRQANLNPDGETYYAAIDVADLFFEPAVARQWWNDLKRHDRHWEAWIARVDFPAQEGRPKAEEGLTLDGVFRLIESVPSPRAERLKTWLAQNAVQRLREAENPEMLAVRARRLYEQKGYPRRWVDKRLRGVSARQELTSEWYRRGVGDSDEFRALTNDLMRAAFGMDVESYRRYKNVSGANANLRDHMSDLELALTSLGETVAVALHQARDSHGLEQLRRDTGDAGKIVARARRQIDRAGGRPVVSAANRRPPAHRRATRRGHELAERREDMHNSSPSHPVRTGV